ncbi:hypothetical protein Pmani_020773 [Petrolisthes manimaculis]|uniref:Uncharacterized protein n=1 Tax=Petrolisthes manimaculis TaxID=1843537 RepID=A0AAE1U3Y0_9EUCA|nr:hypothetical protein Pmani_020773 [Petrolisthes manimaculis]
METPSSFPHDSNLNSSRRLGHVFGTPLGRPEPQKERGTFPDSRENGRRKKKKRGGAHNASVEQYRGAREREGSVENHQVKSDS